MTNSFLMEDEALTLERLWEVPLYEEGEDPPTWQAWEVRVQAQALSTLVRNAEINNRVYELLSISRPGDLYHYLKVEFSIEVADLQEGLRHHFEHLLDYYERKRKPLIESVALTVLDKQFPLIPAGRTTLERLWQQSRSGSFWKTLAADFFEIIIKVQKRIWQSEDPLIQAELNLIRAQSHPGQFAAYIRRPCTDYLPPEYQGLSKPLVNRLIELVDTYKPASVSAEERGYQFWQAMLTRQVLWGTDNLELRQGCDAKPPYRVENLGCEVHGGVDSELQVRPKWKVIYPEHANIKRRFTPPTKIMVSDRDWGELDFATKEEAGGWFIYIDKNWAEQKLDPVGYAHRAGHTAEIYDFTSIEKSDQG